MNRQRMLWALVVTALSGSLLAAQMEKGAVDRAKLEQVIAAWTTMQPAKAAPFYAKDAGLAFYDIAPRKYTGWAEYEKGTADMFKTVKSLTMKLGNDAAVHTASNLAWATATVDGEMVNNDGSKLPVNARWTSIWEKRGDNWLIVHEHFSMPLPESPPAK